MYIKIYLRILTNVFEDYYINGDFAGESWVNQ